MSDRLDGQIGNFGGINVFTDCAFPKGDAVVTTDALKVIADNKGKPHTCTEDQRCSRWRLEQPS